MLHLRYAMVYTALSRHNEKKRFAWTSVFRKKDSQSPINLSIMKKMKIKLFLLLLKVQSTIHLKSFIGATDPHNYCYKNRIAIPKGQQTSCTVVSPHSMPLRNQSNKKITQAIPNRQGRLKKKLIFLLHFHIFHTSDLTVDGKWKSQDTLCSWLVCYGNRWADIRPASGPDFQ